MKFSIKLIFNIVIITASTIFYSCDPEGGRRGSPNAPEIVDQEADTTFNQVPGQEHHGIDTYRDEEGAEDATSPRPAL